MTNVMKQIDQTRGKVNPRYDLSFGEIQELDASNKARFNLVRDCFRLGYFRGMKAAKAEMRTAR